MEESIEKLWSRDGKGLCCRHWLTDNKPKGQVLIIHGILEHSGRYRHLAEFLCAESWHCHAIDLRGHGLSEGRRGHVWSWNEYLEDLDALYTSVRQAHPGQRIFVYCHSMGGLLGLDWAMQRLPDLGGLIASAPALGTLATSKALLALGRFVNIIWPTLVVPPSGGKEWQISRVPEVKQALREDPLTGNRISTRLGMELMKAKNRVNAHAPCWRLPLLLLHGGDDNVASPRGSMDFATLARKGLGPGAEDLVQLKIYQGGYHELISDLCRDQVLGDLADWLETRLTKT